MHFFDQVDFMASWEGHDQKVEEEENPYPSSRLLVAHRFVVFENVS
jgi:hypothetical protein